MSNPFIKQEKPKVVPGEFKTTNAAVIEILYVGNSYIDLNINNYCFLKQDLEELITVLTEVKEVLE